MIARRKFLRGLLGAIVAAAIAPLVLPALAKAVKPYGEKMVENLVQSRSLAWYQLQAIERMIDPPLFSRSYSVPIDEWRKLASEMQPRLVHKPLPYWRKKR